MTLAQLNYIITIAETRSINKAAERLYVSQPSLTSAVQELEKELGITLFYRSGERRNADKRRSGIPSLCQTALQRIRRDSGAIWKKRNAEEKVRCIHSALFLCG